MQTKIEMGFLGEGTNKLLKDIERQLVKNMPQLIGFVECLSLEPEIKAELIKYIQSYPDGSLNYIAKNFRFILNRCIQKVITKNPTVKIDKVIVDEEKLNKLKVIGTEKPVDIKPMLAELTAEKKSPKWTIVSANQVLNEIEKKEAPKPVKKEVSKNFDQIAKESLDDMLKFIEEKKDGDERYGVFEK